jgi:cell wall-associated NlpC family hydrolase
LTTPLNLLDQDSGLYWQQLDQKRRDRQDKQAQQDVIVPDAASLDANGLYGRLDTIRADSASAAAGSIAADNTRRQYDAAVKAAEVEKQRQKALEEAYKQMQSVAGGAMFGQPGSTTVGGSAGGGAWGSGGAQGVANVLRQAGFPESAIPTMMAIGMAESSWNPNATHSNSNGSVDNGLFQINTIHRGNSWYPQNPMDPLQSAQAAYAIWKGAGGTFRDWTVYNTGAYKKFIPSTVPPIQPYVANTVNGLSYAQVGQAKSFSGVPTTTARAKAIEISRQVLNIPYVWGGNSLKSGVDCSGLVQQVYAQMGISMPRQARAQATTGVRVSSYNQLQPGDLVAFKWAGGYAGPNIVSHISIYIGNGQIIEAAGGSHGDIRSLGNSAQDRGAIYIHTRFPGE